MSRRTVLGRSSSFRSYDGGDGGASTIRKFLAAFGLFVLMIVAISAIGETYGTRKPTPGRNGPEIVCTGRFGNQCVKR